MVLTIELQVSYHEPRSVKYVFLGIIIYGLDLLFRAMKTRICIAKISVIPELNMTRVELSDVRHGWRAGQHVRLRLLSAELGLADWAVAHPFTIANASSPRSGQGLVLMCKKAGKWTNKLYSAAEHAGYYGIDNGYGAFRQMRAIIEGPYGTLLNIHFRSKKFTIAPYLGGLGNMVLSSYSSVMIVAGGSGVTFALSEAEELVNMLQKGSSRVRFIEIIWNTQDMGKRLTQARV